MKALDELWYSIDCLIINDAQENSGLKTKLQERVHNFAVVDIYHSISSLDEVAERVQNDSDAICLVYPQLQMIYSALQDTLSRKLFIGRVEYSITHILTGVYRAMICDENMKWLTSKTTYAERRYGLHGLWSLLYENYPVQKREIFLFGYDDEWNEYNWIVKRFVDAMPGLGITIKACVMPNKQIPPDSFCGIPCISVNEFSKIVGHNSRIIIGVPGWVLKVKDIITRYQEYKDIMFPIADNALPQYFEFNEDVLTPLKDEVFVDIGAFNLDNSIDFAIWAKNGYEKIFAFEPDPTLFKKCSERLSQCETEFQSKIEMIPLGLSSVNQTLQFPAVYNPSGAISNETIEVETVSLDCYLHGQRITFVKMDVEGAEMDVLRGMRKSILLWKPKLAVCVYHKHEDIFEICNYLLSLVPEYRFWFRHYNSNETETVLFCSI